MEDANQESPGHRMTLAIGAVITASAELTAMVEQIIVAVSGTELPALMLLDAPLGSLVRHAKTAVAACNTDRWFGHPPVDQEVQQTALTMLRYADGLVAYRNRVAHDRWSLDTQRQPDGANATRPTRYYRRTDSTIATLNSIAWSILHVAAGVGAAERAILALREHDRAHLRALADNPVRTLDLQARQLHDGLASLIQKRPPAAWHWIEVPLTATPSAQPPTGT